jgi:hypothetical protein
LKAKLTSKRLNEKGQHSQRLLTKKMREERREDCL